MLCSFSIDVARDEVDEFVLLILADLAQRSDVRFEHVDVTGSHRSHWGSSARASKFQRGRDEDDISCVNVEE
ncbi:hypothetical protein COP2_004181 [Malus domestica]